MFYYGVDLAKVVLGEGPAPSLVLALVQRLPEGSLTAALAAGTREAFGWDTSTRLLADIYDGIAMNTRATGNWAGKPPELPLQPRPQVSPPPGEEKPKVRVTDVFKRFSGRK